MTGKTALLPCPCCGFLTISKHGAYEICEVCLWEDDGQADANADEILGGANDLLSLSEARANYGIYGACNPEDMHRARPPLPNEIPEE